MSDSVLIEEALQETRESLRQTNLNSPPIAIYVTKEQRRNIQKLYPSWNGKNPLFGIWIEDVPEPELNSPYSYIGIRTLHHV
jgi:hypothetical protein